MKSVVMPISNGFEEIEAVTIVDILRRAGAEVVVAGVHKRNLTGAHNIEMIADSVVAELDLKRFDMVVLAGGYENALALSNDPAVQEIIKRYYHDKKIVAAICASPLALYSAGVLDSTKYTCYSGVEKSIGGSYVDRSVVEDGNVITSQGPATAGIFALYLVERLFGKVKSDEVANAMLFHKL